MPSYTTAFVDPSKWERPQWSIDMSNSLRSAGEAAGGAIVGGITAAGEGVRTVVQGIPEAIGGARQSFADFQSGLPVAQQRVARAANAIGQSFEATRVSFSGGPGELSEFQASSQTLGVEEAISILLTGEARAEDRNFRDRREDVGPLIDIELTEDQKVIAGAVAVVLVGAIIIATAPVSLPLLASGAVIGILAASIGTMTYVAWEMFGDDLWSFLGEIGEINPRGRRAS